MKKLIFILLIFLMLLSSCKDGNVVKEPDDNLNELNIKDYYPLIENVKYSYKGEGSEFATYTVYIDYLKDNKIQTRTNNGGTEIVKVLELEENQLVELYSRAETYFRENFIDEEYTTKKILLKEPLKVGSSWTNDNITSTITSINKEVVTSEGNIEAIEVTTENPQGTIIEYYAKNKGLVKTINKGKDYEVISTLDSIENNVMFTQNVTLFYPSIDGVNLKTIDVQISFSTNDEPKDVIAKMIKDLSVYEMLSVNTKINDLYFDKNNNNVYIDFSKEFITEMNAGAGFEGMILQSLANTLGTYYGVQDIYITIDGGPYESGHILIKKDEPLKPDYSNIINE